MERNLNLDSLKLQNSDSFFKQNNFLKISFFLTSFAIYRSLSNQLYTIYLSELAMDERDSIGLTYSQSIQKSRIRESKVQDEES